MPFATCSASTPVISAIGTLQWQAPELFEKEPIYSPQSDVYALGVVAWEVAAQEIPFQDIDCREISHRVAKGGRPTGERVVDTDVMKVIERCWAQSPLDRGEAKGAWRAFRDLERKERLGGLQANTQRHLTAEEVLSDETIEVVEKTNNSRKRVKKRVKRFRPKQ
jgi:serine/threonine protein kinase